MSPKRIAFTAAALLAAAVAATATPAARADCASDATVSYVGSDWGPTPLWRVSLPATSWDVAANSADEALALVGPLLTCPAVPPAQDTTAGAPAATDDPAAVDPAPAPTDDAVAPAPAATVVTPAKSKTAKHGLHAPPATARRNIPR